MDIKIIPGKLSGSVVIPPSKSLSHRALICAALADGESLVSNVMLSQDIAATIEALEAIGARFVKDGDTVAVQGIRTPPRQADIRCRESGSTLRFLVPLAAALGVEATFHGEGRLPSRPLATYRRELTRGGITFQGEGMPFTIHGALLPGQYDLEGNISSQYVSGMLFALPLLAQPSRIVLTSPLESLPYAEMTIETLRHFGVSITETEDGFAIQGNQPYRPAAVHVEGDDSQAAFFLVANALGSSITCEGLSPVSMQGDRAIADVIAQSGLEHAPIDVDVRAIPDLVPALAVLAAFCNGRSYIRNAGRLRIKESDRLEAMASCLNRIGGSVRIVEDSLVIDGVEALSGGEINCYGDHRIAMAMAVAATRCDAPITLCGAECVAKSYPHFFEDYRKLGGSADVITVGA